MSSVPSLEQALERYVAPFEDDPEAWGDVLRRAGVVTEDARPRRRRRVAILALALVATTAALAVSPVGGAVARSLTDFSAWLSGSPGEPASQSAQQAFEDENARSWARFPQGTALRSLIVSESAGGRFELFGFRSGDSLCLRLAQTGLSAYEKQATSCTPLHELRIAQAPAVIATLDYTFGRQDVPPNDEGFIPARASATFGVVADGVRGVELTTNQGRQDAIVEDNAFLSIVANPPLGTRTKSMLVRGEGGERLAVPLAEAPYGNVGVGATPGVAPGPTRIERRVKQGTIGWLERREERGQALAQSDLGGHERLFPRFGAQSQVRFARVIAPDPNSEKRVAIGLVYVAESSARPSWVTGEQVCAMLVTPGHGSGGGCSRLDEVFADKPFTVGILSGYGGDQRVVVSGLASDDVARMELYLADGERRFVPLRDNYYLIDVERLKFPARLVAYDGDDRVVGIETYGHDPLGYPGPRPVEGEQRVVRRVRALDGSVATLKTGPSTTGTRCWQISFRDGHGSAACLTKPYRGSLIEVHRDTSDLILGTVSPKVARAELRLADGERVELEITDGVVIHALSRKQLATGLDTAVAFDANGRELGRQTLER